MNNTTIGYRKMPGATMVKTPIDLSPTPVAADSVVVKADRRILSQAQQSAAEAAGRIRERYQTLVEEGNVGIVESDADAVFTYCNAKFARMLNCTPEQVVGHSMFDFMTPEQTAITSRRLQLRRQGQVDSYMGTLQPKGGPPIWVQIAAWPLPFDERGRYAGALAVVIDIQERKELEDALKMSDRLEAKLAEVEPRLDNLRKEATRLVEECRRIEQLGFTYAKPTYRQGKYLVLVHQMENAARKREYIGSDQDAINEALSKVTRGQHHKALTQKKENIENRIRTAVFKLDQVLETITPSLFERY